MTDQPDLLPKPSADQRLIELETRLAEQEVAHQKSLTRAELKTLAVSAGMVDLDGLKLLDLTSVKLNANGEIENADRIMVDLRRSKPWLFNAASSSTTAPAPPSTPPVAKRATAMTDAEWQSARSDLLRRR